jgi:hypothetical protein
MKGIYAEELARGGREETEEHADTYRWLEAFVEEHSKLPSRSAFGRSIARDHIVHVDPNYYKRGRDA